MKRISARLAVGGVFLLALACNLDKGPTAPGALIRADQVATAISSFVCDVGGAIWEGDPDEAVLHDLAPSGVMRIAFNYNNRNNAARNPVTGELTGPGIDMSCKLGRERTRSSWRSPTWVCRHCWRGSRTATGTPPSPSIRLLSRPGSRQPFRTSVWTIPISSAATPRFKRSRTSMPPA